mmetsp:Transcript_38599/g.69188  ORF Transcript_38599/g.69188 Transcript_38599/m.69188 type:complete len:632 (-) Transcript_38599:212-2107(-)
MSPHVSESFAVVSEKASRNFQPSVGAPLPKSIPHRRAEPVVPLPHMSEDTQELLRKATTQWLKCNEIVDLLTRAKSEKFPFSSEAADMPEGGTLFLFDRMSVKFFRMDGHEWRKKGDGKSVRETHEKLKLDQVVVLNCYYAHAIVPDNLQRRCYWLLDSGESFVLVHYLTVVPEGTTRSDSPYRQASPTPWDSGTSAATSHSVDPSCARNYCSDWEEEQAPVKQVVNYDSNPPGTLPMNGNSTRQPNLLVDLSWEAVQYTSDHDMRMGGRNLQWENSAGGQQQLLQQPMSAPVGGSMTGAEEYRVAFSERHPAEDLLDLADELPDLPSDVPGLPLDMGVGPSLLSNRHPSLDGATRDIAHSIDNLHMTSNPGTPVLQQHTPHMPQFSEQHQQGIPLERGVMEGGKAEPSYCPQGCDIGRGAALSGACTGHVHNDVCYGRWTDVDTDNLWNLVEPRTGMMPPRPSPSQQQQAEALHGAAECWPCQAQAMSPEVIHPCGGDRMLLVLDGLADYDPNMRPLSININSVLVTADRLKPSVISFITPAFNQGCVQLQVLDTSVRPWRALCPPTTVTVAQEGQVLNRSLANVRSKSLESLKALDGGATDHDYILKLTHALLLNMPSVEIEAMALQVQ